AVDACLDRLFGQLEQPGARRAGAAAPRPPLFALDDAGRLAVHVGMLARVDVAYGPRLERVARLDARPADVEVALQRGKGAVRAAPPRHARTTTNQRPSCRISPPSSSASCSPVKTRL